MTLTLYKYLPDDLLNAINIRFKEVVEKIYAHSSSKEDVGPYNRSLIKQYTRLSRIASYLRSFPYIYTESDPWLRLKKGHIEEINIDVFQWYKDCWYDLNPKIIQYIEKTIGPFLTVDEIGWLRIVSTSTIGFTSDEVFISVLSHEQFIPEIYVRINANDLPPVIVTKVPVIQDNNNIIMMPISEARNKGIYPESFLNLFQQGEAKVKVKVKNQVKEISPEVKALTDMV